MHFLAGSLGDSACNTKRMTMPAPLFWAQSAGTSSQAPKTYIFTDLLSYLSYQIKWYEHKSLLTYSEDVH